MSKPLNGTKIAVLIANGFNEQEFTLCQRPLAEQGASLRIISTNQGLVNGWDGKGWGHNFAVDASLNTALGVDYDSLLIPGGQRSLEKLKLTAHSKRFIGSFVGAMKPVVVMGDALELLIQSDLINGYTVTGSENLEAQAIQRGAEWDKGPVCSHQSVMTWNGEGDENQFVSEMIEHLSHNTSIDQAA